MANELKEAIAAFKKLRSTQDEDALLAARCMDEHVTYRLNQEEAASRLTVVRLVWRMLRLMASGKKPYRRMDGDKSRAIFECNFVYEELEHNYVSRQTGTPPGWFISKEDLPAAIGGTANMLRFTVFAIGHILRCWLTAPSGNKAMQVVFVAENAGLSKVINDLGVEYLYDFAPYLIDSNWSYVLRKGQLKEYAKLPSPGPLYTHNRHLLCDHLILCNPYHFEELPHYKDVRYKKVSKWLPEYAFTYIDRYVKGVAPPPAKTIGFYSHGSWIRQSEQHADDGLNIGSAERQLLADLAVFLREHPSFRLIVFPHPREKKDSVWAQTKQHYATWLGEGKFEMAHRNWKTAQTFEEVDIAVAAFSTIVYERLFCGYKTLIGNYGIPNFPMQGSTLERICFSTQERLEEKLLEADALSSAAFFSSLGLVDYRFDSYPYFSDHDRNR